MTIIGQLPRELVITTAMLDVLLPAATVGLLFGLLVAVIKVGGYKRNQEAEAEAESKAYEFRCGTARSCSQFGTLLSFHPPEEHHDGIAPWGGNNDAECAAVGCVRLLPEVGHPGDQALPLAGGWAGWPGHCGATCVSGRPVDESSPESPGLQTRFQCPWAPTLWAKLAPDGTVSRSERAGDAERLKAACEAQRAGL